MTSPTLPPPACLVCMVGACRSCTGRLVIHDVRGGSRETARQHRHRPGDSPAARVIADIPIHTTGASS